MAIWLVELTEEESKELYDMLNNLKKNENN